MTKDPEKIKAQRRKYYIKHREKMIRKSQLYYFENKERKSEYSKEYRDKNKQYIRMQHKKHKALERYGGNITLKDIQLVYENNIKKYGTLTCYLCLKKIEFGQDSLDHKIPMRLGGDNSIENLDIAHFSCNSSKSDKTIEEFLITKG